jgi:UDP-N-acetyl-D-galactosamine dehydrogenase
MATDEKIGVIGLGYVGLPVAVALAEKFPDVVGFDISQGRVTELRAGNDRTGEIDAERLRACSLRISASAEDLADRTFFIVTVPTPIDASRQPDLGPVRSACRLIGAQLKPGAVVVFESTVYPGVTEDICGPLLEEISGLKHGTDFALGYSPERINPGDKEHRLETITKVVAADGPAALERMTAVYGAIIDAGLHLAPTIKVAEAAKVIENTQRDLNVALMNELSVILDRMGVNTKAVLDAAGTKWNFLRFTPGLVGGHCIGVDPYYLTHASEQLGYRPEVILAGRRINDDMGRHVARKAIKMLIQRGRNVQGATVAVLGLTFKEDVPDLRNSKVPDILAEFADYGIAASIHDPLADPAEAQHEYGVTFTAPETLADVDVLILAVNHRLYLDRIDALLACLRPDGVFIDLKSAVDPTRVPEGVRYWSL